MTALIDFLGFILLLAIVFFLGSIWLAFFMVAPWFTIVCTVLIYAIARLIK